MTASSYERETYMYDQNVILHVIRVQGCMTLICIKFSVEMASYLCIGNKKVDQDPVVWNLIDLLKWLTKICCCCFFLYLEKFAMNCYETYPNIKSLPQQQTGKFSNIYHKSDPIYLDLKKVIK